MAGIAKSTTTPALPQSHDYISILQGPPKDFIIPTGNHPASGPTYQQTSHMHSAATPKPNGLKASPHRFSKADEKNQVPNYNNYMPWYH